MPGVIGRIGTALEGLSGPLAVVAAGAETIWNGCPVSEVASSKSLKHLIRPKDSIARFRDLLESPLPDR